jgi:hypothetical protein
MVVDSGFTKRQISFFLQIIGLSNVSLTGETDENFAAFICSPTLTRHI